MDANLESLTQHANWVLGIFLVGYAAIVFEELLKINKTATAMLMAIGCWAVLFQEQSETVERHMYILTFQMFKVSQVVFFLMGAIAIVEVVNEHKGFQIVTQRLIMRSKLRLLWTIGFVTFFLSAVLDNLTTTIVMLSLIQKLLSEREDRWLIGGVIVIAANAGGAWTPIGDVSTTLLWIYGQVTTVGLIQQLFLPSVLGLTACLLWCSPQFRGELNVSKKDLDLEKSEPGATLILIVGAGALVFVPFFKIITHMPPFLGMIFGLSVVWAVTDILHNGKPNREHLRVPHILPRVDVSVILFYLGVLLAINALESAGILHKLSLWLDTQVSSPLVIPFLIGIASSVVDNVSLVAAAIGMYGASMSTPDSAFWQTLCYCAGTGGSILIIGSAAGIALMAIEKVSFGWYARKMMIPATLTYLVGLGSYYVLQGIS